MATGASQAERIAAYDEIMKGVKDGTRYLDQFNDAAWRTKESVLRLFTDAITRLESKEAA